MPVSVQETQHAPQVGDERARPPLRHRDERLARLGAARAATSRLVGRARHHHLLGVDPLLAGQQRQERLVLGLLQAARRRRRSRLAVPEGSPQGRDELRVVGVAAVHLHRQRVAVLVDGVDEEHALRLSRRDAERAHLDPQPAQRQRHVVQAGAAARRAEEEMDRGGDHRCGQDRRRRSRRGGRADQHRRQQPEQHDPAPDLAGRLAQVGRRRHDDRTRNGESQRREVERRPGRPQRVPDRRPRPEHRSADGRRRADGQSDGDDEVEDQAPSPADDGGDGKHRREHGEKIDQELPEAGETVRHAADQAQHRPLEAGGRIPDRGEQRQARAGDRQQDHVGRAAGTGLLHRRREQPPARPARRTVGRWAISPDQDHAAASGTPSGGHPSRHRV